MTGSDDWRPTASIETLRTRARLLGKIRDFFASRGVMEVETPLLSTAAVTDPHLHSMSCRYEGPGAPEGLQLYLQTSPEFAMKRLLAAGSGPIFQICKAFRNREAGRFHNPEFTLLEWYRPGFDHHALMDEVDALFRHLLGVPPGDRWTYAEVFERHVGENPHLASTERLRQRALELGLREGSMGGTLGRDECLQFLMSRRVEPYLGGQRPCFIYDYPASQAALARVRASEPPVAERFEMYCAGIELANGFHELCGEEETRRRFEADLSRRRAAGESTVPLDERLLSALSAGMPPGAGVALGVDRLVMWATGARTLAEVLAFSVDRA